MQSGYSILPARPPLRAARVARAPPSSSCPRLSDSSAVLLVLSAERSLARAPGRGPVLQSDRGGGLRDQPSAAAQLPAAAVPGPLRRRHRRRHPRGDERRLPVVTAHGENTISTYLDRERQNDAATGKFFRCCQGFIL